MKIRIMTLGGVTEREATVEEQAEISLRNTDLDAAQIAQWRGSKMLSRFEMGEALIAAAILTEEQTEDFLRGVIPAPLNTLIALLPEADRSLARRLTIGARDFARSDTLWLGIANAPTGPSASDIDALFGWVTP